MKKIAIFGGTFDPVHNDHIEIVKKAYYELQLDMVIIMPSFIPPHKQNSNLTDSNHRFQMTKLAFSDLHYVKVSDLEIKASEKSYTYLTTASLRKIYPNDKLYFIVGGDMLSSFHTWKNPSLIIENVELVAFNRLGYNNCESKNFLEKTFNTKIHSFEFGGGKLSSTMVRTYKMLNLNIEKFTPKNVIDYICENNLYVPNKYYQKVNNNLAEKRRIHTANVILESLKLNDRFAKLDRQKVVISALLHDVGKNSLYKDYKDYLESESHYINSVLHQYIGAIIAKNELGVADDEIINAIKYHTTAKPNMSNLEKIIYLADMIEPSRQFDGVDNLRAIAQNDLDQAFIMALKMTYEHLKNSKSKIDDNTIKALAYIGAE